MASTSLVSGDIANNNYLLNDEFSATGDQNKWCCDQQIWHTYDEYEDETKEEVHIIYDYNLYPKGGISCIFCAWYAALTGT